MDFDKFFQPFFGSNRRSGNYPPFDNNSDDEDGDNDRQDEFHFHFDMFDIHRQMESMSREMEEMFKNFGAVEFFPAIEQPGTQPSQNPRDQMLKDKDQNDFKPIFIPYKQIPPVTPKNPRDQMLKDREKDNNAPVFGQKSPFGGIFTPRVPIIEKKGDTDVDGKLDVDDVARLFEPPVAQPSFRFQSVTESRVRGLNGMEHRKTIKNADGSSEVIVTRTKGDQTHTVIIKKDKNGVEERIENFQNMDADDLSGFNKSWNKPLQPSLPVPSPYIKEDTGIKDDLDVSLFNKFFGTQNKENEIGNKNNAESGFFKKLFNSWWKPKS